MAKRSPADGGTPGAQVEPKDLSEKLANQFRYDEDVSTRLLALAQPCEAWIKQYYEPVAALVEGPEAMIVMAVESCASRFLRNRVKPAGIPQQRDFLEAIDVHASALIELLTMFPNMDGTTADFFKFMDKVAKDRGSNQEPGSRTAVTYEALALLKLFARYRLMKGLAPDPSEELVQRIKRKNTYPRFVLIADLMACWVRVTGREAMATASNVDGVRKVSPALEFLSIAMPPILRSARFARSSSANENIDDQVLRKDMADIKRFWKEGLRPEIAYAIPDWGAKHLG